MCGLLAQFLACGRECEVVHCCVIVFQVGVGGLGKARECAGENFEQLWLVLGEHVSTRVP